MPSSRADGPLASAGPRLETLLAGSARRELVDRLATAPTLAASLTGLRDCLTTHTFETAGRRVSVASDVAALDRRTRQEGFHVLNDWDGKSDRVNDQSIPVDVLDYIIRLRGADRPDPAVIAILLDYYFVHLLELLALRAWDEGDTDGNLDEVGRLLTLLQGAGGSGQPFADDVETLLLLATSHFELHERGYALLLERVRALSHERQLRVAIGHCASMGSHLRFGFEASYARDTVFMRDDNVADYPWLCYALLTVMRALETHPAPHLVESLLNGLSADARAFVGEPPASLKKVEADRAEFRDRFLGRRDEMFAAFEAFRPGEQAYSPLSFFFNFAHNVRKGTVVDALLRGKPWNVSFNDLLTASPADEGRSEEKIALATTLMAYARRSPDRIRGQMMPVIVYDPGAGRQAFGTTLRRLKADS